MHVNSTESPANKLLTKNPETEVLSSIQTHALHCLRCSTWCDCRTLRGYCGVAWQNIAPLKIETPVRWLGTEAVQSAALLRRTTSSLPHERATHPLVIPTYTPCYLPPQTRTRHFLLWTPTVDLSHDGWSDGMRWENFLRADLSADLLSIRWRLCWNSWLKLFTGKI